MRWLFLPIAWAGKQARRFVDSVTTAAVTLLPRKRVKPYGTARVEDLPDAPRPGVLYVAGEGQNVWAASMVCPCGCKEVIELNLLPQVRPRWSVVEHAGGTASLDPSVWRTSGCHSHFILANGFIRWCR